ncbi:MAG: c-type cytochrome [Burkholderiales bacterium]
MKISLAMILAAAFLIAGCSRPETPKQFASPEIRQGLELAEKSQCLSCHALDHKVIGPAWNDVSARYNRDIRSGKTSEQAVEEALEKKIAMGGKGNWIWVTGGMSMPPNAPRVPTENIRKLTRFILSLKK